jgi:prepilin-type processing-associated H-X9-DG protein
MDVEGKRRGLTLTELVIAIAFTGILVMVFVPSVKKFVETSRRDRGANCLKKIAIAYRHYCDDNINGRTISEAKRGKDWAIILAQGGGLDDPNVYCFSHDGRASKAVKKTIIDAKKEDHNAWEGENDIEFSVYLINNIPVGAPLGTTPIAFTRGIPEVSPKQPSRWPATGIYGDKGGHIAYLDGHVEWYGDLGTAKNGKLVAWGGNGVMTNDIRATIPSTATILSADGRVREEGTGDKVQMNFEDEKNENKS